MILDNGEATCAYCDGTFGDDDPPHWVLKETDSGGNPIKEDEIWHEVCIQDANGS